MDCSLEVSFSTAETIHEKVLWMHVIVDWEVHTIVKDGFVRKMTAWQEFQTKPMQSTVFYLAPI